MLSQIPTGMPLIQLCFFTKCCIQYTNSLAVGFSCIFFYFCSNRLLGTVLHNPQDVSPHPECVKCLTQTSSVGSTNRALRGGKIFTVSAEKRVQLHWRVGPRPLGRIGVRMGGVTEGHHPWMLTIATERNKNWFNPMYDIWRISPAWGERTGEDVSEKETEDLGFTQKPITDRWEDRTL